jgi:hypothetical protein
MPYITVDRKYIVVKENELRKFEHSVNLNLEKGYKLIGGLSMTNESVHNRDVAYAQAMFKE